MTQRNTLRTIVLQRVGEPSAGFWRTHGEADTPPVAGCLDSSRSCETPRAFTLVELLVVIGILAMLAALLVPAVMMAMRTTRNAAMRSEINMLQMAMLNYQSEYGVLPPCYDSTYSGGTPANSYKSSGESARHLRRLFPRCSDVLAQLNTPNRIPIDPRTSLYSWLGGYTADPTSPLQPDGARVRLYDFDRARVTSAGYYPSGSKDSPFVYIDASHYVASTASPRFSVTPSGAYFAHRVPMAPAWSFEDPTQPFFNADTFQILCAGRDGIFGNDDDLSNFWPGTRSEYLESMKAKK